MINIPFCLIAIVFFILVGQSITITYGNTSNNLGPGSQELTGSDNKHAFKIQHAILQNVNQNNTRDVELSGVVSKVIDGDTLDINGTRIRLALVNTPERGQPGFDEAKKFVESLCLGKKGELDVDNGQRRGDRYGREIGVVFCDGLNANEKIMSSTGDKPDKPTDEVLIRVWENERYSRNFAVKLMWENMKYFSLLIGSLLTVYTALLGYISTNPISFTIYSIPIFNIMILFPIPAFIIVLALFARNDLIERRRRFLLVVTHLLKLEQLLGLHQKIGDRLEYFKADEYLFAEYRNNLSQGESKKNFIDIHMSEKPSTFKAMQNVYSIFIGIAVVLILFGIIVLFFHQS